MSKAIVLGAEVRERAGKGAARATRRAGRMPGVIYGNKLEPVMISLDPSELMRHLREHGFFSRVFEIEAGGTKHRVLARDVQFHPVTDRPIHIDFMRFGADTRVHVDVEVMFQNEAACPGLKKGGVLNIVHHAIELICSPEDIPSFLTVDLTGKEIGASFHLSDIALPGNVKAATEENLTVASIVAPLLVMPEEEVKVEEAAAEAAPTEEAKA